MTVQWTDMTATEFFKEFQNLFEHPNILPCFKDAWKNRECFTKLVMPYIAKILSDRGYADEHQYEYYKIDVIGWKDRKNELSTIVKPTNYSLKDHFWHLGVAVEHENDQLDWTDELIKLLYINCPLRIVIGYYPENQKEQLEQIRAYASNLVSEANANEELIRSEQEYLLILGENHNEADKLSPNTYSAFVYDVKQKQFQPIQE